MKKFLAVYLGSESSGNIEKWEAMDEKSRHEKEKAGMDGWMTWAGKHKNSIADMGCPVGETKRIDSKGVSAAKNEIVGYTIVEAENHEAAAKLFINHPHFAIFPGDCVEVMECLPIPGTHG